MRSRRICSLKENVFCGTKQTSENIEFASLYLGIHEWSFVNRSIGTDTTDDDKCVINALRCITIQNAYLCKRSLYSYIYIYIYIYYIYCIYLSVYMYIYL